MTLEAPTNSRTPIMDNPSDEAIAEALRLLEYDLSDFGLSEVRDHPTLWSTVHNVARTIDQLRVAVEAWSKVLPIRVRDGPDYAEVHFSNGTAHCTQAMTMNPQDWRDLAEVLTQIRSGQ